MGDSEKLDLILKKFSDLETRLVAIETTVQEEPPQPAQPTQDSVRYSNQYPEDSSSSASPPITSDICRQFDALRERLSKVSIPPAYKLNEQATGIKQESKPCLKVISKTARHAETGLKLLSIISSTDNELPDGAFKLSAEQTQDLFTIFASQQKFLQAEYTSLVVKSTFNAETSRIFRSFENNSSVFSEQSLRNVRIAAELSAISDRQNSQRGGFRNRGSFNSFSRFGRAGRRNFTGGFSSSRGNHNNLGQAEFPTRPPSDDS